MVHSTTPRGAPRGVEEAARMLRGIRAVEVVGRVTGDVTVRDVFGCGAELPAQASGALRSSGVSVDPGAPGTVHRGWPWWPGNQISEQTVGAGAGSSARSWLVLRGGVIHRWSLRIPLTERLHRRQSLAMPLAPVAISLHGSRSTVMKGASCRSAACHPTSCHLAADDPVPESCRQQPSRDHRAGPVAAQDAIRRNPLGQGPFDRRGHHLRR